MRDRALCDNHAKRKCLFGYDYVNNHKSSEFEEPEEPNSRSFFSEIIGTISDVKFSHSGRYLLSRDYLTVKVWDLHMENKPIMSMQVIIYYLFIRKYLSGFCTVSYPKTKVTRKILV